MIAASTIPADLRRLNQWVRWEYRRRGNDKPTKVPMTVAGTPASSTDPTTWATFGAACESTYGDGIGFVFQRENGLCGIDLDNSIGDDGKLKPWAANVVSRFGTYTEISPSGKGVKLWCYAAYPGDETGKRVKYHDGQCEMYHEGRYFTVTGDQYPDTNAEIRQCQSLVDELYSRVLNPPTQRATIPIHVGTDNAERCKRYIERCPDAISGESGHDRTLRIACECFRFGLSESDAWRVMDWFNAAKCKPAWTQKELAHKIADGMKKVLAAGEFGMRLRSMEPPRVPIAKPPEQPATGLDKLIGETIDGKRVNIAWPWSALTTSARALLPGTVTVLSGMGGSSKSLLVSESCLHWLETGVAFAVFHLEEDREFHLLRALAQLENQSRFTHDDWMRDNPDSVFEGLDRHRKILDSLGKRIWDAPASEVSLNDLIAWIQERVNDGTRVLVIDPVTAADSGKEPWIADKRFVLGAKKIMRESGASLVVVTHPRDGNPKHGGRMDNHAGGQAYNRFTQCVLCLETCDEKEVRTIRHTPMGPIRESPTINRELFIRKSRNGAGGGHRIGYWFAGESLRFHERGLVIGANA